MALELNLKVLEAQAHKQTALGGKAPHMNQTPIPLCSCALAPRQTHGNMDCSTFFSIRACSFSGIPAFLRRVVAGRWTAGVLWLMHGNVFALSALGFSVKMVLAFFFLLTSLCPTKPFPSFTSFRK